MIYYFQLMTPDTMDAFNTEAMKISSMGVTITISSGDNGVAGDASYCDYSSGSADAGYWTVSSDIQSSVFLPLPTL